MRQQFAAYTYGTITIFVLPRGVFFESLAKL